ncbi:MULTISPECIES: GGDEF domain-containing protein [Pseudomonas]|uniref:Sensor domain-containing diguanylate cyclase n=3 Tax=Pseudomonas TaxID=286 RepID=A0A6G6J5D9_PSENT|nr:MULTISPECIES: sensor domain-containing diguanylate cyclase [Pseudomonas]MBG6286242.1 sensor domain-containing diguanylate cyclase [Pseudomonas nitroreducens]MCJ1880723.1 sensor domain-containing diguanylate cyclase [Pseudomonas nitroreducens]MCJ1894039.1 sensor domain-containing diguanylate cyclase [Pseudomonas nitroreducens]MDG9856713.1 sensor domain-containing diguanylate cyclase [Pseudomonas nitroreducens]MDH1008892.1 sensor domain-containing diguanylate cyclase [Pseudomonas nicosulfuron
MDENKLPADQEEALLALLHSRAEVTRLKEREQLFSALLASVNSVLWAFDWQAQRMVYVSPAYERIFGRSAALLLADYNEWRNCIYPDDLDYAQSTLQEVLERGAIEQREYRILRADGEVRWLSDKCFVSQHSDAGLPLMIVGIAEDITDKKHLETELHRLATTDVLTQSSNRRYFFDSAEQAFRDCKATSTPLAFLLLDVDDFKKINDVYGHQVGDVVLQRIAQSGAGALRRGDLFGRIGGEEFAVLLPGCDENMARQIGERLQREVQRLRFNEAEHFFSVTISQGLTLLQPDDQNLSALYSRSDAALYQAKRTGKDRIVQG